MRHTHRSRSDSLATRSSDRHFQIGPKIRVGGSVGKLGQKLKIAEGKLLSNKAVGMGLSLIPGVGPGIAAAANVAGHALDTSNGGIHTAGDLGHMALDAGTVYAGGKALGAVKSGLGALKSGQGIGAALKTATGGGSEDPSRFRSITDFLKNNGRTITDLGGLGEGIYDRYQQNQQIGDAKAEYAKAQPLRDAAMAGLMDTSHPDLSGVFADPSNPQGRYRQVNVGSRGRL